jgi:DNA-binding NtrC family response regulator
MLALILEDEYLIANDLAGDLKQAGFEVNCAASDTAAEAWLERNTPSVAILDIKLLDGPEGRAAARLKELGVPFTVHSGYDPAFQARSSRECRTCPKPAPVRHLVWRPGWPRALTVLTWAFRRDTLLTCC